MSNTHMIDLLKNKNHLLDVLVWGLTTSWRCTVKSTYLDLIDGDTKYLKKYI
jgi:hypothetical protein